MATKRRRGAAKRTYAEKAARRRGAPGKRLVGETAAQSANDRRQQRKKVARMAGAAREAKRAEAARTAGRKQPSRRTVHPGAGAADPPESGQGEAAFRAAEESAALAGAEVERLDPPLATVSRLTPRDAAEQRADQPDGGAIAVGAEGGSWEEPAAEVSAEHGADRPLEAAPPLGWAMADLVRSALGLARAIVSVPFRIALAVPRLALRAVMHA